ncbi:hypothetical protein PHLGIDRAFT_34185 [Phlebiopsis gigantea 11061_1 CR5-6]|uniref:WW domain-containing protein n=1 Tax=Phlebiopsis gigantea (strain 11061_1 CR5-6) TaxID=745531 RepID=A0A0C3S399_PHLG1|nr:hypothetical protein PHLGIDRAFT_34185 [Phlebiopsis gigantea 11061_1 CR5-6]
MTSPAASPSPSTPAPDDKPAPKTAQREEQTRSDEDDETGESPEAQSPAAESPTSEAQTASEPAPVADTASTSSSVPAAGVATASAGDWQAVWSPQYNAYYFHNSKTQETTWNNPLEPQASSSTAPAAAAPSPEPEASTSTSAAISSMYALQAAAAAQGIDPSLAYLDPSLAAGTSSNQQAFTYTAKFNARTGAFAKPDGRDPNHVSEYERAKRMSEAYFDVGQWEKDLDERNAQEESEGKKRKKPTKKDLERFKEQKRQKKIAKTAWLRT